MRQYNDIQLINNSCVNNNTIDDIIEAVVKYQTNHPNIILRSYKYSEQLNTYVLWAVKDNKLLIHVVSLNLEKVM